MNPKKEDQKCLCAQTPFTKVTARSLHRFNHFFKEDKTNLTNTSRNTERYAYRLNLSESLEELILSQSHQTGRKLKILDAGCGEAVAINMLLSNHTLDNAIDSIIGISLHYFKNIKKVMVNHGNRFSFYLGKIQEVLPKIPATIDLLVDVWGAYAYSEDKLEVLKLYHDVLKPGGIAYVYINYRCRAFKEEEFKRKEELVSWLTQQYPHTFSSTRTTDETIIKITKSTTRFPVSNYFIDSSKEIKAYASSYSLHSLKKGNAVAFGDVVYKSAPEQSMQLRLL